MCTWLYVRFDCGITIRLPNVWYACQDLKYGTCIGRWGCHEQRLLKLPLPCMDMGPCCELCRVNPLSRGARAWCLATAIILIERELAATFGTVYWELYNLNPHERYSRCVLGSTNSTGFTTEDLEQRGRRSERSPSPDCLRRGESLPRVSTPCPVPEPERLPPMIAWRPDIERRFVHTQIFEIELNGSGFDGNESHSHEARGKQDRNLFRGMGNPQLTCYSRVSLVEAETEDVVASAQIRCGPLKD